MKLVEKLLWSLSKFRDLDLKSCPLDWVTELVKVDPTLISYRVEHIVVLNWTLFGAKYKINPQVNILRYIVGFERLSILLQVFGWGVGPLG